MSTEDIYCVDVEQVAKRAESSHLRKNGICFVQSVFCTFYTWGDLYPAMIVPLDSFKEKDSDKDFFDEWDEND